jgi:ATP-dependent DNA helicase RecQ
MSRYLQQYLLKKDERNKDGNEVFDETFFYSRYLLVPHTPSIWHNTIKGGDKSNPARDFFEQVLTKELDEYSFIQPLVLPETKIEDIIDDECADYVDEQVDFYLPQAQLVIEIDGAQHTDTLQSYKDRKRDNYLKNIGVETIRISTDKLKTSNYHEELNCIIRRLNQYPALLSQYSKFASALPTAEEIRYKLIPTAVMRFQILLIELLLNGRLSFDKKWKFHIVNNDFGIISNESLIVDNNTRRNFADIAIEDLWLWLGNLYRLKYKKALKVPGFETKIEKDNSSLSSTDINIDFSLFKRYTDENQISPHTLFVRTDYFDDYRIKNYFKTSTCKSINYQINDDDKPVLRFFLQNIFGKEDFRDGQFPIIANAMNLNDTIGLLPTGGGKSLCYQMPCLLQPSVNFVVCPITSLMRDQCDNMKDVLITNVAYISGDLEAKEKEKVLSGFATGKYLFIWISPERFQVKEFRQSIGRVLNEYNITYAVIDEVHCLSEWGHDFRTSYLNLTKTIEELSPKDNYGEGAIKFLGLTATASVNVLKDIRVEFSRKKRRLEDENIKSLLDYSRKELYFEVVDDKGEKYGKLKQLIEKEGFVDGKEKKSAIVFTPVVNGDKGCYNVSKKLNIDFPGASEFFSGKSPTDGGLTLFSPEKVYAKYKKEVQDKFKNSEFPIMVATKAFGMGIDNQNIYYTFHYGFPSSVESWYQEAGRAGRWNKNRKENEVAKCYLLYTPQNKNTRDLTDRIFDVNTTISQIDEIQKKLKGPAKKDGSSNTFDVSDLNTQLFFLTSGRLDIKEDYDRILSVIENFFKPNQSCTITYGEIQNQETDAAESDNDVKLNPEAFEKILYRLMLLGIVKDWTRDFKTGFEVDFLNFDDHSVMAAVKEYVSKYDTELDVVGAIQSMRVPEVTTLWGKSIWFLLSWIFNNIFSSRKQSLKDVMEWCDTYTTSEALKERIDNYFRFTGPIFILQHISENPRDYVKWFEVFYKGKDKKLINDDEFTKRRDGLSRFLESYHNNTGLNFVSGIVRLRLNDYDDTDGRPRFEASLKNITDKFNEDEQADIMNRLLALAGCLDEENKYNMCVSIKKFLPQYCNIFIEKYKLFAMLNGEVLEQVNELNKIKNKLYESVGRI